MTSSPRPLADATLRLFVALWPDAAVRRALAVQARRWRWPPAARRYAPADWHVTLHFLGAVPASQRPALEAALEIPWAPLSWALERALLWPRGLAVLTGRATPALAALHGRLGDALRGLGLPLEGRPLHPHVTLARRAEGATPPATMAPITWPATEFVLVHSTGDPARRYRILHRYPATGLPAVTIAPPSTA